MKANADRARSIELSYLTGQFVTDHLIRLHKLFEGDLPAAIVLATIAHRSVQRYYEEIARPSVDGLDKLVEAGDHVTHMRPCNALSVSSATGIPRETVRRKVKWLERKGWITVGDRGQLDVSRGVSRQFSEFDRVTTDRFEESARQVLRVIDGAR